MAMANYSYGKPMILTAFILAVTLSSMMMNVSVEARRLLQTNQPSVPNLPGNIPTNFPPLSSIPTINPTNPINNAISPLPNIPTNIPNIPQLNIPPLPSNIPTNIPNVPQMNIPPLPSNIPTNIPNIPKMSIPPLPFNMPSIPSFPFFSPPPTSP